MSERFYLGRGAASGVPPGEGPRYDLSADRLTTHAVVIGMTGSGKTGLVVDLLEEASLAGVPAVVIDPKGDLANRLLVFPGFPPQAFAPFTGGEKAPEAAEKWGRGTAEWGIEDAAVQRLAQAPVRVFTPGALPRPVNLLERFAAPAPGNPQEAASQALADAAGLLMLAGVEGDAATSPEGLLLIQVLMEAWTKGQSPSLEDLVRWVLNPPFERIGVLDLDTVIPPKDRTGLAMRLNALLASPALAAWKEGPALDVGAFLAPGGGQTIFTLAHLSEAERLFFLGILLSELAAWTRKQPGSDGLRALVVFDEVFGYFPPHPKNPPTKAPLLTLLKQARAFGVGVVMATQNPVDLDYKGLTNAGLWFLGRLQTDPDRERVAEGLGQVAGGAGAAELLASLPPRTFVVHDVKADAPVLIQTRHCISYLAGPLTPPQLERILGPVPGGSAGPAPAAAPASTGRPTVPAGWDVSFGAGGALAPHLVAQVQVTYRLPDRTSATETQALAWRLEGASLEAALSLPGRPVKEGGAREPAVGATCAPLPPFFGNLDPKRAVRPVEDAVGRLWKVALLQDPVTGLSQRPGEDERTFRDRTAAARQTLRAKEEGKLLGPLQRQEERAREKLRQLEIKAGNLKENAGARTTDTFISAGLGVLGGLFGSRRSVGGAISRTLNKKRMADRAKDRVEETEAALEAAKRDVDAAAGRLEEARGQMADRFDGAGFDTVDLQPSRSGVNVLACSLMWAESGGA